MRSMGTCVPPVCKTPSCFSCLFDCLHELNMACIEPANSASESSVVTMNELDDSLMSMEKLDRTSPELWPEQIPGMVEYTTYASVSTNGTKDPWTLDFTSEDISLMNQFSNLSMPALIAEVKRLHDLAYQLGLEEAKEMTRGKYLNILLKRRR